MLTQPRSNGHLVNGHGQTAELYQDQWRKGGEVPYIGHLMAVAGFVIQAGGDEDEAIAALLHDTLEDLPHRISARTIEDRYGDRVLAIVQGCSDDLPADEAQGGEAPEGEGPPAEKRRDASNWFERKARYHAHLENADPLILTVSCADKIDNVRAIMADYRRHGEGLWERFNAGREGQLWNYRALLQVFKKRRNDFDPGAAWLADELERLVAELSRLVDERLIEA